MKKYIWAFTLVELIIVVTIIAILTTVWFYSYVQHLNNVRDSVRKNDLATIDAQLNSHKRLLGWFPIPWDNFEIHSRGNHIATQWLLNRNIGIENTSYIPMDPRIDRYYTYSITKNRQEFQLAATLENNDSNKAILRWNYTSVSKNILPTIVLAIQSEDPIEIHPSTWDWDINRNAFIFDKNTLNLPYDFTSWVPVNNWVFLDLLTQSEGNSFWQSSSFRNCEEIWLAWKHITADGETDEYQIRSNTWVLIDQNCTCTHTGCINAP